MIIRIMVGVGGAIYALSVYFKVTFVVILIIAFLYFRGRIKDKSRFIFRDTDVIRRHPSGNYLEIDPTVQSCHVRPATILDASLILEIAKSNYIGMVREISKKDEAKVTKLIVDLILENSVSFMLAFTKEEDVSKGKFIGFSLLLPLDRTNWRRYKHARISDWDFKPENIVPFKTPEVFNLDAPRGILIHSLAFPIDADSSEEEKMQMGDLVQEVLAYHIATQYHEFFKGSKTVSLMYSCDDKEFNGFFWAFKTNDKEEAADGGSITIMEAKVLQKGSDVG